MVSSERIKITLFGGAPWGFRLAGGGALPLTINKIRKKSQAHTQGLRQGDAVISINGIPVHDKSQDEALDLVDNSGKILALEIFRGDIDELSREIPKKPIQIGGGEGGLTLSATVDDVSDSGAVLVSTQEDTSSGLILTASVDDVTSDTFKTEMDTNSVPGFSATVGDVSESNFTSVQENTTSGFTLSATVDDISSSSNMVDNLNASLGDASLISTQVESLQSSSALSPTMTQPFIESKSPVRPSPQAISPVALSPKPKDPSPLVSTPSPKPLENLSDKKITTVQENTTSGFTLSATVDDFSSSSNMVDSITAELGDTPLISSQVESLHASKALTPTMVQPSKDSKSPNRPSPQAFSPVALSPKPKVPSPQAPAPSPKPAMPKSKKYTSPELPAAVPPPASPKPSNISTTSKTTIFDDGQTRKEVTQEQQMRRLDNGYTVVHKEMSSTTSTAKTPFVKSQASAFNVPQQSSTSSTTRSEKTTSIVKPIAKKEPAPFSSPAYSNKITNYQIVTPNNMTRSSQGPPPVFKPSKFVPGQGKKDIPGLYTPTSPQVEVNVHAMYRDGKENVQPTQPLFQVKNIMSEKSKTKARDIWKPNLWLPGHQPSEAIVQERTAIVSADDFSPYSSFPVPVVQPGQSLVEQAKKNMRESQRGRRYEDEYILEDQYDYRLGDSGKIHIFAPPVEIQNMIDSGYGESPYSPYLPYSADGEPIYDYDYEDGPLSPDSSLPRKKSLNLYSDSAFYDTPSKSYPTIGEQIKLCKKIAQSLTSQANRRARGAKMFMKRKRKSSKWIHDGQSEWSSSAGDVANINELDSELSPDEGGSKPLFYFKIPNLKNRISSSDKKMALTQEQFEKLRLQAQKCDHKTVSPNQCFDLVADLKGSKGRGGRMFEKRRNRAEKYVVDEKNARRTNPKAKLEHVLTQPVRQETTPWNAAIRHGGSVDAAFSHINEMERNQKLNQILKLSDHRREPPAPMPPAMTPTEPRLFHTSLKSDQSGFMLRGKSFNRTAKGWNGGGEYPVADQLIHISAPSKRSTGSQPAQQSPHYGDYNSKIKAWQQPGESPYVQQSLAAPSHGRRHQDHWEPRRQDNVHASRGHNEWGQQERTEPKYDTLQTSRQVEVQNRPVSWQSDSYDANSYRDEYDYNYVPVDYKFNQGEYPNVAYMQPIIPGTDL